MKVLYILNFARRLNQFSHSAMLAAQQMGMDFHVASHFSYADEAERKLDEQQHGVRIHQVDFLRNPLHPGNRQAYRQICQLMEREQYDLVHTNTPIGGVHGRLAARKYRVRAVIYQAHGFHFYKGGPLSSWLMYYPVEKWLARYTDALITINREDEALARKRMRTRRPGGIYYVPGIGIDTQGYAQGTVDRAAMRASLGVPQGAVLALSVGELNRNKNHQAVLHALQRVPAVHYAIAGVGELLPELKETAARLQVQDRVHFLGYREDIRAVYKAADIFCLPSFREGLSASIMEAMASGLPLICSDIRGNRDLVVPQGGMLVRPDDTAGFAGALSTLASSGTMRAEMAAHNLQRIKDFDLRLVVDQLKSIYATLLN